jgi:ABC-type oligopeptide transport system substrate-binding subunit
MKKGAILKRILPVSLFTLLLGLMSLSCGKKPETQAASTGSAAERLAAVQELNLLIFDNRLYSLDPAATKMPFEWHIVGQTQEGLFRVVADENGLDKLELAGAESYTVSNDGLVYTFKLRDHNWEDGKPVTAGHYVDAMIRLFTPENAFTYIGQLSDVKNVSAFIKRKVTADKLGLRAVDDKTLEITLEALTPYFINKLAVPVYYPVRLDIIGANTDQSWGSSAEKTFSNGPFKVSAWVKDSSITLVKNPAYWDAANVKLEKVTLRVVDEDSTRAQLFNSSQLDAVSGAVDYFETWKRQADSGAIVLVERFNGRLARLDFPFNGGLAGLTDNKKIRQALSLAIDRQELVELAFNGLQVPAYGLFPRGLSLAGRPVRELIPEPLSELAARYLNDTEALRTLFREGLREENYAGDLDSVSLQVFTTDTLQSLKVMQQYLKQTWEDKLGIHITIDLVTDQGLSYTKMVENQYDISIANNLSTDYNDPLHWLNIWYGPQGAGIYFGGYASPGYDTLIASLNGVADTQGRTDIYASAEKKLLIEDWQVAPIYYSQLEYFIHPYVKNFHFTSLCSPYEYSRAYILEH